MGISYFFDTSALVKLYHYEDGTDRVERMFKEEDRRVLISELATVEMHSSLAKKVREKEVSKEKLDEAIQSFYKDCIDGRIEIVSMTQLYYKKGIELILTYAIENNLRTLDAIQLAVAQALYERGDISYFVCADQKLCDIAKKVRLDVINPEN